MQSNLFSEWWEISKATFTDKSALACVCTFEMWINGTLTSTGRNLYQLKLFKQQAFF